MASNGRLISSKDSEQRGADILNNDFSYDDTRADIVNKRREVRFKASHGLLIVFFLWILSVPVPDYRDCLLTDVASFSFSVSSILRRDFF